MFKPVRIAVVSLLSITYFIVCAGDETQQKTEISVKEVKEKIDNKENVVLLDVRTHDEYVGQLGHLDTSILIPIHELEQRISELDAYKSQQIIVICKSGFRSHMGAKILREAGFDAVNMIGGMMAYRRMEEEEKNKKKEIRNKKKGLRQ